MTYRVSRWFLWTFIMSLIPVLGALLVQSVPLGSWNGLSPIIGSGQLLTTCIALLIGGLKELSDMKHDIRHRSRDFLNSSAILFAILIALVYGGLVAIIFTTKAALAPDTQQLVTVFSLIAFGLCFMIAASAVAVSSPIPEAKS